MPKKPRLPVDPLLALTVLVGLAFLAVVIRALITGDLNKDLLSTIATMVGALIAAYSTRKSGGKKGDDDDD